MGIRSECFDDICGSIYNSPGWVGLDSEKRIFNEKIRKDAKRAYKEGKDGKRDY